MGFVPVNTDHLEPRIDPVPTGTIDAFGRDDGWIGDRPADCGNFWLDRRDSGIDDVPYLAGGLFAAVPGGSAGMLGSIWVGGDQLSFTVDVFTGSISTTDLLILYVVADDLPAAAGEQVIVNIRTDVSYIVRSSGGALSGYIYGTPLAANTNKRLYISALPVSGGWLVRVAASNLDGSSYAMLAVGVIDSPATMGWLSLRAGPHQDATYSNLQRTGSTSLTTYYSTDFVVDGIDGGWTADQGTWTTDGSGAYTSTGNDGDTLTRDIGHTDHTVRVEYAAMPSGVGGGVFARYVDANNTYLLEPDNSAGILRLLKKVSGAYTVLAGPTGYSFAAGDILEFSVTGTSLVGTLIRGGSVISTLNATDSSLTTATRVGLRSSYNSNSGVRRRSFLVYA